MMTRSWHSFIRSLIDYSKEFRLNINSYTFHQFLVVFWLSINPFLIETFWPFNSSHWFPHRLFLLFLDHTSLFLPLSSTHTRFVPTNTRGEESSSAPSPQHLRRLITRAMRKVLHASMLVLGVFLLVCVCVAGTRQRRAMCVCWRRGPSDRYLLIFRVLLAKGSDFLCSASMISWWSRKINVGQTQGQGSGGNRVGFPQVRNRVVCCDWGKERVRVGWRRMDG